MPAYWKFESTSLPRGVHCEPAGHPLKGSRPKLQRASQVSIKTARAFRSLFTAGILKSVMGKDRSRDASPKRLQRLAPPAEAWGACPLIFARAAAVILTMTTTSHRLAISDMRRRAVLSARIVYDILDEA